MLREKRLVISVLALIGMVGVLWFYPEKKEESVHYHAGFVVYIDGVKQDFSDYKYMNFVACSEHDTKKSKEEEQIEKAHLHDGVGDVVHVHRTGGKWSDLFKNIGVNLPVEKGLKAYSQGKEVENVLNTAIAADSSIVFEIGKNNEQASLGGVTIDRIKEVEAKSELCGST